MLSACDRLSSNSKFVGVLESAQNLSRAAQKLVTGRAAMAQEFTPADIRASFRSNGTIMPNSEQYDAMLKNNFADWKLEVGGLVEKPMQFSLAGLRKLPSRTQITRHDCVEGWSAIGKWKGVPLHHILALVKPLPEAQYVVFRCADPMDEDDDDDDASQQPKKEVKDSTYYESVDMDDAYHPQTILAYDLNDARVAGEERRAVTREDRKTTRLQACQVSDEDRTGQGFRAYPRRHKAATGKMKATNGMPVSS